jgi:O-methyltransferase
MSAVQIVNILTIALVILVLARFAWNVFFNTAFQPAEWIAAKKAGLLPKGLAGMERRYTDKARFFTWWLQVERLRRDRIPGSFAEVGVYRGESARILHRMDSSRPFHLFDTFEGFRKADLSAERGDAATYTPMHFADTNVPEVLKRIGGNRNILIHKGDFPEKSGEASGERFALVHLDADLYKPTRAALEFFYPRLSPGGVIMVHDYNHRWEGVRKAVDEFLLTIPEILVHVADADSTVLIVRNKG